jgi:hypothetical protein
MIYGSNYDNAHATTAADPHLAEAAQETKDGELTTLHLESSSPVIPMYAALVEL